MKFLTLQISRQLVNTFCSSKNCLLVLIFFLVVQPVYGVKVIECPDDDTYIYEDTVLTGGFCNVEDSLDSDYGVIIIKADNIVLDCNGTVLNGSGYDFKEYPRYRFGIVNIKHRNVEIKNCVVQNFFDGILLIKTKHCKIHNNTLRDNNNGIVIDNTYPYYEEKIEKRNFTQIPSPGYNHVYDNLLVSNSQGINLIFTMNNLVFGNEIHNSVHGILVQGSHKNTITANKIYNSFLVDVSFTENSTNNTVIGNVLLSEKAVSTKEGSYNLIIGNIIKKPVSLVLDWTDSKFMNTYLGEESGGIESRREIKIIKTGFKNFLIENVNLVLGLIVCIAGFFITKFL